jgi:hypothetical protein
LRSQAYNWVYENWNWVPVLVNWGMLAVGAVGTFFAMSSGRRYIALHSDSQVDAHLQSSARVSGGCAMLACLVCLLTPSQVIAGMLGPAVFLFAESTACNLYMTNRMECSRLETANISVVLQLVASALYYMYVPPNP